MLKLHCSAVWYSCQLVAKMLCSLCYNAGKILIATRIANMMIARIVTLSKKVIAKSSASALADSRFNHM